MSSRISPTAHYTGYVWSRNGLSHPALTSVEGRVLYESCRVPLIVGGLVGGPSLERYLLARHRAIDSALESAIVSGAVSQVIEIACGLSPRGWRFASKHGATITYIEADLPGMVARKRAALERMDTLSEHHRLTEIDALTDTGPGSLTELAAGLDRDQGLAVITEGLIGYLDTETTIALWHRIASVLHGFPAGLYLSDLHTGEGVGLPVKGFRLLLAAFVRGGVHLHFDGAAQAAEALRSAGFDAAEVNRADPREPVRIIEASTVPATPKPASRRRSTATPPAHGRTRRTPPSG